MQPKLCRYEEQQHQGGLFGAGPSTPAPPPPVPQANTSAAAAVQQQSMHADPTGQTYASTLLTGAAQHVAAGSVATKTLLGG